MAPLLTEIVLPDDSVPVNPVESKFRHWAAEAAATVTVTAPLAASKKTSSAEVGAAAPLAPPEVVAHFEPAVASHVADPPTQNLVAIGKPP